MTKMAKISKITLFMTKTAENHTFRGRTYLYSPYKGVAPPSPRGPVEGVLIVITVILVLFDQLNIQQFVVFYLMYERWAEKCLTNLTAASKLPKHFSTRICHPPGVKKGLNAKHSDSFYQG